MAEVDLAEFVSSLHERVQERVEADPDLMTRDAFVAIAGEFLTDDGSLDDLETCYLRMPWQNRTIEIRPPGQPPRHIKPLECIGEVPSAATLATITMKALSRAHRRGEVEELFVLFVQP